MSMDADERYLTGLLGALGRRFRKNYATGLLARPAAVERGSPLRKDPASDLEGAINAWGGTSVHMIGAVLAMLSGNDPCAAQHVRAFQLHHLKAQGRLFPLDAEAFLALSDQGPGELVETLAQALIDDGALPQADLLRRAFELYVYPHRAVHQTDQAISRLVKQLTSVGDCAKACLTARDIAAVVPTDRALVDRYAALRGV